METTKSIHLKFSVQLSEIQDDFNTFILYKCQSQLQNNIYEGCLITKIIKHEILKDKKINNNGSICIRVNCTCQIIDPIIDSIINIKINDINKMGYSYKKGKICIFIPIHLCKESYSLEEDIQIKIIGKRIEENIVCIGQPTQ